MWGGRRGNRKRWGMRNGKAISIGAIHQRKPGGFGLEVPPPLKIMAGGLDDLHEKALEKAGGLDRGGRRCLPHRNEPGWEVGEHRQVREEEEEEEEEEILVAMAGCTSASRM
ncbi:hypothetical protein TIFTF001_053777 [Ficus carica]|uniref:Uncharacterized protein n=1 Tax=Ficus carica TaxID=3494 RepID=A0AA88EFK8_FICCA|nr:hypothetical protein TIFTF001_053774 [Ficus carica]GMN73992.1 hypothetical protein TIFTF001_053775 [Ficus carica]GMN73996.1 hypothetical protein TIFTF001_053776 [Ficus carica]GMN74000.1 hypothetical protein TIFTF001_053777 [Ficus carica]